MQTVGYCQRNCFIGCLVTSYIKRLYIIKTELVLYQEIFIGMLVAFQPCSHRCLIQAHSSFSKLIAAISGKAILCIVCVKSIPGSDQYLSPYYGKKILGYIAGSRVHPHLSALRAFDTGQHTSAVLTQHYQEHVAPLMLFWRR